MTSMMSAFLGHAADTAQTAAHDVHAAAVDAASQLAAQAEAFKNEKMQLLREFEEEKKRLIANAFTKKLTDLFDYAMRSLCEIIKEKATDDPYMPSCVRSMILGLIDNLFPDFKAEVREAIIDELVDQEEHIQHGDPPCCGCGWSPLAWVRYTLFPYDRNIWRLIRDPFWWFFLLVSLVPRYGVAQIFYVLVFLIIDHSDEFQLVQFITKFKALQFINLGLISAIIGSVQYYVCTSQAPNTCDRNSPQEELFTVGLFVLQVIVIWIAFAMIGCSSQKGGIYYQLTKASRQKVHELTGDKEHRKGTMMNIIGGESLVKEAYDSDRELAELARGRLFGLLVYDLIVFLICAGLTLWVAFANLLDDDGAVQKSSNGFRNWKFQTSLYWIKALYGFLALPFVVLTIPGVSSLFSHAKPTGYNPYGNTVMFLGKEEEIPTPWRPTPTKHEPVGAAAA